MRYLRAFWNAVTAARNFTINLLFLAIVAFILFALLSKETITVPDKAALVIDPTGAIVEQKRVIDPFSRFLASRDRQESESLFRNLKKAIKSAETNGHIKALVLDLDGLDSAPMSMLQELGDAIDAFKTSGKRVYAFGSGYTQTQYYLACHADEVYIDKHALPAIGGVFLTGFGVYPAYFKSALDKLKIHFHVFRVGQYKSAVEPFLRDNMSEAAKDENRGWLNVLWSAYEDAVIKERGITREAFDQYTNHYDVEVGKAGDDPVQAAVKEGLVDESISREEFDTRMTALVGGDDAGYSRIDYRDYLKATEPAIPIVNPGADKIAVITAKGTILDGDQPAGNIGADSLSRLIKKARDDDTIKAVVLRIDSPGGSAAGAERIRSELELTQRKGKPVVVSMSGYAASGGYWISATANKIFAQPTTITGSIGTFLMFPTFEEGLGELGVHSDGVGTTALSNALNPLMPINPILERTLQKTVDDTYSRFVNLVAQGRDMTPEQVDKIAQGHVWSGKTALDLGLVDAIGTVQDAIASAALLADVKKYDVIYLEKTLTARERLINQLVEGGASVFTKVTGGLHSGLGRFSRLSAEMTTLLDMSSSPGIYLQCLSCNLRP